MKLFETKLPEVVRVVPDIHRDDRGYFIETWHARRYREAGIDTEFVQDNLSYSRRNALRGLHYQIGRPQGKLVRVVRGRVFDVAVDLRKSSESYAQWVGVYLSEENGHQLWIPPGFAHGFLVLSDVASFEYKCSNYYSPQDERTIRWNDPTIGIEWPIENGRTPNLSGKDAIAPLLDDADTYT